MIDFLRDVPVNTYLSTASVLVMICLLILADVLHRRRTESLPVFFQFCRSVTFTCVLALVFHSMLGQSAPWTHVVALVSWTLEMAFMLLDALLWGRYVDQKLSRGPRAGKRRQLLRFAPLMVVFLLLMINLFTQSFVRITDTNESESSPYYLIFYGVPLLYFVNTSLAALHYDRKSMKVRFVRFSPIIWGFVLGGLPMLFLPFDTGILGFSIGVTLVYFSMVTEIRFVDDETGLFSSRYLTYLLDLAASGKMDIRSALVLEAEGNLPACVEILRNVLHQDGDVIRAGEKQFLMFSKIDSRSTLQYLSSLVDEAVERYNGDHPEEKVRITARCRMRAEGEDVATFLRSAMEEKTAGSEMRGIVSMITELDRLDKEVRLATEIQIALLPTNFPPFPDRTEFSLFASATPAKGVGGDFYDFFLIDSDHLALVIADVSGKGIPAALFMMMSKTLTKNQLMTGCDPATALARVNGQLCESNSAMMFVTIWAAVVELSTGKGMAVNAGHEKPALCRAGEAFSLLTYRHGASLGINPMAKYANREFELNPGDCVFVYTDGVPEATRADDVMFGDERLLEALNQHADEDPERLISNVHDAVTRFVDDAPQFDDITMLCFKYHG